MHVLLRVVSSVGLLLSTCFRLKLLDQRLKYVLKYARHISAVEMPKIITKSFLVQVPFECIR